MFAVYQCRNPFLVQVTDILLNSRNGVDINEFSGSGNDIATNANSNFLSDSLNTDDVDVAVNSTVTTQERLDNGESNENVIADDDLLEDSQIRSRKITSSSTVSGQDIQDEEISRSSSNQDVCLSSFLTSESLTNDIEAHLKDLLLQKLSRGTLFSISGTTAILDFSKSDGNSNVCYGVYTHLLQSYAACSDVNDAEAQMFLVCLIDEDIQKFNQFDHELVYFFERRIKPKLRLMKSEGDEIKAFFLAQLPNWHLNVIDYLPRTVKLLRNVLPALLTEVCFCVSITVTCTEEDRKEDVQQFIDSCLVFEALFSDQSEEKSSASVSIQGRLVQFSPSDSTKSVTDFCKNWSAALLNTVDELNPAATKQKMQDFQLRASHDLNLAKRSVCEAVSDYYALYRFSLILKETGNAPVLIHHLTHLCANIPAELDVLEVIIGFLGFSKSTTTVLTESGNINLETNLVL